IRSYFADQRFFRDIQKQECVSYISWIRRGWQRPRKISLSASRYPLSLPLQSRDRSPLNSFHKLCHRFFPTQITQKRVHAPRRDRWMTRFFIKYQLLATKE